MSNHVYTVVLQASGNNFYYALLLLMLFICCLPVAYSCVWLEPSWHCGPFRSVSMCNHSSSSMKLQVVCISFSCLTCVCQQHSEYERVYHILTKYIESKLPDTVNKIVDYLTSPGTIIPALVLLVLIIYHLMSRNTLLVEENADLKSTLRKEKDSLNPEMSKSGQAAGLDASGLPIPLIEKKHVRISEEVNTSDRAQLISQEESP